MASEAANGLGGHFWLQKWAQGPWWHIFQCLFSFIVPEKTFIPRRKEETKLTCRPACSYLVAGKNNKHLILFHPISHNLGSLFWYSPACKLWNLSGALDYFQMNNRFLFLATIVGCVNYPPRAYAYVLNGRTLNKPNRASRERQEARFM